MASGSRKVTDTIKNDAYVEGINVKILSTGQKGKLVKVVGGWCTVSVADETSSVVKEIKVRKSAFLPIVEDGNLPYQVLNDVTDVHVSEKLPAVCTLLHIEAPALHKSVNNWIIFSDLHVKDSSINTCEHVLKTVHETALKEQAGIIFLGDFWHVRGQLNVELLNRILRCFSTWTRPVIFIPGNHDQVTLGGAVHALEPLQYAFSPNQMLLISEPAICLDALWIPYRRDSMLLKSILSAGSNHPDVHAIFCHADVRGAFMNDNMRSREGIDITSFPSNIPIFSGHFHKPHTIIRDRISLCYVGSPYQTSLSEANQIKYLYNLRHNTTTPTAVTSPPSSSSITSTSILLSSQSLPSSPSSPSSSSYTKLWHEVSRLPIDIGRKYFKAVSFHDPIVTEARSGDRLVVTTRPGDDVSELANNLRKAGVEVDIREELLKVPSVTGGATTTGSDLNPLVVDGLNSNNNITDGGGTNATVSTSDHQVVMDPITAFSSYIKALYPALSHPPSSVTNIDSVAGPIDDIPTPDLTPEQAEALSTSITSLQSQRSDTTSVNAGDRSSNGNGNGNGNSDDDPHMLLPRAVLEEGLSVLRTLCDTSQIKSTLAGKSTELRIEQVTLKDFGPYGGNAVQYPLSNRGLVLLRGQSSDGTGADSNGAGKTTLAMSVMWGLTGSMDTRLVNDGRAADVAFDNGGKSKRTASVTVTGTVNGQRFELTRRRGKGGKQSELLFYVDGIDLTKQSTKDTQETVDSLLGIGGGLLQRCCFFGQHSSTLQALLGLTDTKLKTELAALVDLELWNTALLHVRQREKAEKDRLRELTVETRMREDEVDRGTIEWNRLQDVAKDHQKKLEEERLALALAGGTGTGTSSSLSSSQFGGETVTSVSQQLSQRIIDRKDWLLNKLQPIKDTATSFIQNKSDILNSQNKVVSGVKEKMAHTSGSLSAAKSAFNSLEIKYKEAESALQSIEDKLRQSTILFESHLGNAFAGRESTVTMADLKAIVDTRLSESAAAQAQYNSVEMSLKKLLTAKTNVHNHSTIPSISTGDNDNNISNTSSISTTTTTSTSAVGMEASSCPTCGQPLFDEGIQRREMELRHKKQELQLVLRDAAERLGKANDIVNRCVHRDNLRNQQQQLMVKVQELQSTMAQESSRVHQSESTLKALQSELQTLLVTKEAKELELATQEKTIVTEYNAAVLKEQQLAAEIETLKEKLNKMQKEELQIQLNQKQSSSQLAKYEATIEAANASLAHQTEVLLKLQKSYEESVEKRKNATWDAAVLDRLEGILGPRGIQHFIFIGVIKQLERIANSYLNILADGGIQLSLQGEAEGDRIVKNVLIRGADGQMHDRALSQLSGGQWRRVSMSLDFAFAEIVRRRGILRCNMIVLDEILTHLDASGREAVGSVFRAMVNNNAVITEKDEDDDDDKESIPPVEPSEAGVVVPMEIYENLVGGGCYETVLVILQDLAAAELEEAFDHIDVVVKDNTGTKVVVDGGNII